MGLIGSYEHLRVMNESELSNIACNVNMDMLASPNYIISVLDGSTAYSTQAVKNGCTKMQVVQFSIAADSIRNFLPRIWTTTIFLIA